VEYKTVVWSIAHISEERQRTTKQRRARHRIGAPDGDTAATARHGGGTEVRRRHLPVKKYRDGRREGTDGGASHEEEDADATRDGQIF